MFNQNFPKNIPENEELFRKALKNLRDNKDTIPNWMHIPNNLDVEWDLDEIISRLCNKTANGVFRIMDFDIEENWDVSIMFSDQWFLSWWWAMIQYSLNDDWELEFKDAPIKMKS